MDTSASASAARDAARQSLDSTAAFAAIRQTLATIVALQPEDSSTVASTVGPMLILRHADGDSETYSYQHVADDALRVVYRHLDNLTGQVKDHTTPLQTNEAVTHYLRALVVEVLR